VRPVVGQVRPTTYELPTSDFTYGKIESGDEEGAREVVNRWQVHNKKRASTPNRNFVRLNKVAALSGATTSKQNATLRASVDIRLRHGPPPKKKNAVVPDNSTTYGRPSTYTTGVGHLIANVYQRNAIEKQRQRDDAHAQRTTMAKQKSVISANAVHTRASLGHHKVAAPGEVKATQLFKLKQFSAVPSKVTANLAAAAKSQAEYFKNSPEKQSLAMSSSSSSAAAAASPPAATTISFSAAAAAAAPPPASGQGGGGGGGNGGGGPAAGPGSGVGSHTTFLDNGVRVGASTPFLHS